MFPLHPRVQPRMKTPWLNYTPPKLGPRPLPPGGCSPHLYKAPISNAECMNKLKAMNIQHKHESFKGDLKTHADTPTYPTLKHMVSEAEKPKAERLRDQEGRIPEPGAWMQRTQPRTPIFSRCSSRLYQSPTPTSVYKERLAKIGIEFKSPFIGAPAHCQTVPPGILELEYMCKEEERKYAELPKNENRGC